MKRRPLPSAWIKWRRYRYQELIAGGLTGYLAWEVATGEAKGRYRISRIVGNRAARDAELTYVSSGGQVRFMLTGNVAGLTEEQADAIEKLSREPAPAAK
jgi:hypothetical protein